jgi:hypothetical protein
MSCATISATTFASLPTFSAAVVGDSRIRRRRTLLRQPDEQEVAGSRRIKGISLTTNDEPPFAGANAGGAMVTRAGLEPHCWA